MRARDLRMVPVVGGAWGTAALVTLAPAWSPAIATALWAGAAASLAWAAVVGRRGRTPGRRRVGVLALLAVVLAGAAAVASHVALTQSARTAAAAEVSAAGRALTVTATVVGKLEPIPSGDIAFDAVAHSSRVGARTAALGAPIQIRIREPLPGIGIGIGAVVRVTGTAVPTAAGRRAVFVVRGRAMTVLERPGGILAAADALRRGLVAATRGLPEPAAGLIPGLAVGDTSGVAPALDAAMRSASLTHLTAVSGANCAIVVALAFAAAALCRAGRGVRVIVGALALVGFVVLVTPEPSVVRAAAMAGVAMLGLLIGRIGTGVALLCTAATVVLVADPWMGLSLGFALSAAATAALLVLAVPLARGLARWMPRVLALAVAVPLAAQLVCGPLIALVSDRLSPFGVAANLVAGPAAPIATVVGLAACLAAPIPVLQAGLTALAWLPAAWISGVALVVDRLPANDVRIPEGPLGALLLTVVGSCVVVLLVAPRAARPRAPARRPTRTLRALAGAVLALVVGVATGTAALGGVAGALTLPRDWGIALCDVGQGDAIVVRSEGAVALIDTGPDPAPVARCLSRVGVGDLDLLVLTHFDRDHAGGAAATRGRVRMLLHGPVAEPEQQRLLDGFARTGADVVAARAGMTGDLGAATWTVVWPPATGRAFPSGNDASVTLDVRGGSLPPSIFLGDLSATPQRALLRSGALRPPYPIVKVAHHGSADQSPELYEVLDPRVALISVGAGNDYGHPRSETLDMLAAQGATIVRTDRDGIVLLSGRDGAVDVWRERGPPPAVPAPRPSDGVGGPG